MSRRRHIQPRRPAEAGAEVEPELEGGDEPSEVEIDLSDVAPPEFTGPEVVEAERAPELAPADKAQRYFLAPRRSIVTRARGIVHAPGSELFESDFASGAVRLEELAAAGLLVRR